MSTEPLASVEVFAKDSIHRRIEHKSLPAHKVGPLWKFKLSEVDVWILARGSGSVGPNHPDGEGQG